MGRDISIDLQPIPAAKQHPAGSIIRCGDSRWTAEQRIRAFFLKVRDKVFLFHRETGSADPILPIPHKGLTGRTSLY